MKQNRNQLSSAIKYALAASMVTGFTGTNAVLAQDTENTEELDRIEVTGSRIKRVDIEGANPVTVLDRADIQRTGLTNIGELVRELPAFTGSPLGTQNNNPGGGSTSIDIRGLGANRTLVLLNGRRVVNNGAGDGNDMNFYPLSLVERVEILKDGASAVYGADAVAGVVNIITRRDFEGAQLEVQVGESFDAGGWTNDISFITGGNTERGNFVVGLDYVDQEEVLQGDIDVPHIKDSLFFDNDIIISVGSSRIPQGRFAVPDLGALTLIDGRPGTSVDDYRSYIGDGPGNDTYNYAPVNYMQTPNKRTNFYFQGNYELFDNVRFYTEAMFHNRESEQLLAPLPYDTRFDPGAPLADGTTGVTADNVYNVFGVDLTDVRRRMVETGGRSFNQNVDQWRTVFGVQGDFGQTWTWDVSYNYGKVDQTDTDFGQFAGARLETALGSSFIDVDGTPTCGTPDAPIAGCVPLNLFGGVGSITPDMLDYVTVSLNDRYITTQQVGNFTLAGDLVELPAGPLGFAGGYEYREEEYSNIPDSAKILGSATGNVLLPTQGLYDVDSLFAEFAIPLLADVAFAEILELNLSARYDDFSNFGSNTSTQAGFRWKPIQDLLIRGTYSEVFREPNVSELFGGQSDSFPPASDPCRSNDGSFAGLTAEQQANCIATGVPQGGFDQSDTQVRAQVGGNPNLQPEEGETLTFGFAWSPNFLEGFSMTLDWWDLELEQTISAFSADTILEECAFNGNLCNSIARFPDGSIENLFAFNQNLGLVTAQGYDMAFNYSFDTEVGLWKTRLLGTYLEERTTTPFVGAPAVDQEGRFDHLEAPRTGGGSAYPEWKWNFDLDWTMGNWSAAWSTEFIDELTYLTQFDETIKPIDSAFYHDLTGSYTVPSWGTQITVGVTNLTDEDPPFIDRGDAGTDPSQYRPLGRSWFVRVVHDF